MNILYIGPYRNEDTTGITSLNYLYHISQSFSNTISRPIFSYKLDDKFDTSIDSIENKNIKNIDLLIQHAPIEDMAYVNKIPNLIFIPTFSRNFPNFSQIEKYKFLAQNGHMLYSSGIAEYMFSRCGIMNTLKIKDSIHSNLKSKVSKKINLGIYSSFVKYYTIVEDEADEAVYDLILRFILLNYRNNYCLLLFLQNPKPGLSDAYQNFIKETYKNLNMSNNISKVIVIPVSSDLDTSQAIHNTGDIYIDLEDNIHKTFAHNHQKKYIHNTSDLSVVWSRNQLCRSGIVRHSKSIDLDQTPADSDSSSHTSIIDAIKNVIK